MPSQTIDGPLNECLQVLPGGGDVHRAVHFLAAPVFPQRERVTTTSEDLRSLHNVSNRAHHTFPWAAVHDSSVESRNMPHPCDRSPY